MALSTRVVELDDAGHGTVSLPPAWFAGADDDGGTVNVGVVDGTGATLHAAAAAPYALPFGSMLPCMGGEARVTGSPNGKAILFFDFQ